MALTRPGFSGKPGDASNGAGGAFPEGPSGTPGDKTTGAGKGKRTLKQYGGQVAGAPANLTTGRGALGHTGGDVK